MTLQFIHLVLLSAALSLCAACGKVDSRSSSGKVLRMSSGGKINTLDPALAADLVSQHMTANFYDTLLQYDYIARPYKLVPSMLADMPVPADNFTKFKFRLRDDVYFLPDPCFRNTDKNSRRVTSSDVVFSFMRIADSRLYSPGFWLFRDKIKGLDEFREKSAASPPDDFKIYDSIPSGFEIVDDKNFTISLTRPDPRFMYALAMPYASIVSRAAVEYYGEKIAEHPVGSGPFKMAEFLRDYKIAMERNPEFRPEYLRTAENEADRARPLPLLDRIECFIVNQPISAWLLFLQGEMDISALSKDNFDAVVGDDMKLIPALAARGIILVSAPEFQINYIGFCFSDSRLASNENLRKALSLAYDTGKRLKLMNNRIVPANGPLPPGSSGYFPDILNPYAQYNPSLASEYLKKAGFPDGIDPHTGKPLSLSFDQMGNSSQHRQIAELMVDDMKKIGVEIKPALNNKPRFLQKAQKGQLQLFRLSWVGDYPDGENFFQLFYSKNIGASNRAFFKDETYDRMYEEIITMGDSPQRDLKYKEMSLYLIEKCPWIFESYPISFTLIHSWVGNYLPHDFAFAGWKYLSVDNARKKKVVRAFKPIEMQDLRKQ